MSIRRRVLPLGAGLLVLLAVVLWWRGQARHEPAPEPVATTRTAPAPQAPRDSPPPPALARRAVPAPAPLRLTPGTVAKDVTASNGAFEGHVISKEGGAGVPDAELTFSLAGAAFSTRTDGEGRFTFVPRQPGTYRLAAVTAIGFLPYAPEWGHSPISLTAQPGARLQDITLFLSPAIEYLGRVVDPSGKPVAGAEVRILDGGPDGELALSPLPSRFTSDAKGELRFQAPNDALLEARHPDFNPGRARLDSAARASRVLKLSLAQKTAAPAPVPARMAGRVFDPAGTPLEGALVMAEREEPDNKPNSANLSPLPRALSDAEGRFTLEGLDPGLYTVLASAPGYLPARRAHVFADAQNLELHLGSGAKLSGLVRDAKTGAPIPSFTLSVARRQGLARDHVLTQAVMDPRGRYEVTVPAGELAVSVAAYGYGPSDEVTVTVSEGQPAVADVQLARGGRLLGVVVDAKTRAPLAGASIRPEVRMDEASSALPVQLGANTNARGEFSLDGLAAGLRSVTVSAEGHHSRIMSGLDIQQDGVVGPLTIELTPTENGEEPRVEMVGIGAVLQPKDDALIVRQTFPGGGAAEAGVVPGDVLLRVDGTDVAALGFERAVQVIRGPENSTVRLTVRRSADAQVLELAVVRRKIRG